MKSCFFFQLKELIGRHLCNWRKKKISPERDQGTQSTNKWENKGIFFLMEKNLCTTFLLKKGQPSTQSPILISAAGIHRTEKDGDWYIYP